MNYFIKMFNIEAHNLTNQYKSEAMFWSVILLTGPAFIASYYRQLSADTKIKYIRLKPVL